MQGIYEDNKSIFETVGHLFRTWPIDPSGKGYYIPLHWHHHVEIIFTLDDGVYIQLINEKYELQKGELALFFPKDEHSLFVPEGGTGKYIVIGFKTDMVYSILSIVNAKYILPFILGDDKFPRIFRSKIIDKTSIPDLAMRIYNEYSEKKFGFLLAVKTGIEELMLELVRVNSIKYEGYNDNLIREIDSAMLKSILEYIYKNYMQEISIKMLSERIGVSYSYFSRYFKKLTGKNFTDFISEIRISEAARLLLSSDSPITDIAMNTGFSSSSHFIKQFRQIKGQTPLKFRKMFSRPTL